MSDKRKKRLARQRFEVLPGEGKRFTFTSFKQALVFYTLLLLALVVIVQLGYHWLGEQFLVWRLQVVEAEPGSMQQEVRVKGLITRDEEEIIAPANVVILKIAVEGERIASGEELIRLGVVTAAEMQALQGTEEEEPDQDLWQQLETYWESLFNIIDRDQDDNTDDEGESPAEDAHESQDEEGNASTYQQQSTGDLIVLYSEEPGLVSYYTDGREYLSGPYYEFDSPNGDNREEQEESSENGEHETGEDPGQIVNEGDIIAAGDRLIKVVNNWEWHYNLILPLHPGRSLAAVQSLNITFDFAPHIIVPALLYESEIDEEEQEVRLSYLINRQVPGFERARYAEATISYGRIEGIIVPADALLEKDNQPGIYINQGGRVVFKPVSVLDRQDEKLLVEGIDPYSMVISRPDLVEEGRRFR